MVPVFAKVSPVEDSVPVPAASRSLLRGVD